MQTPDLLPSHGTSTQTAHCHMHNSETLNKRIMGEQPNEYKLKSDIARMLEQYGNIPHTDIIKKRLGRIIDASQKLAEGTNEKLHDLYIASVVQKHMTKLSDGTKRLERKMKKSVGSIMMADNHKDKKAA